MEDNNKIVMTQSLWRAISLLFSFRGGGFYFHEKKIVLNLITLVHVGTAWLVHHKGDWIVALKGVRAENGIKFTLNSDNKNSGFLYIGSISVSQWRSRRCYIQYFPARYVGPRLNYETYSFYIAQWNGLHVQDAVAQYASNQTRNTGANCFSFQ